MVFQTFSDFFNFGTGTVSSNMTSVKVDYNLLSGFDYDVIIEQNGVAVDMKKFRFSNEDSGKMLEADVVFEGLRPGTKYEIVVESSYEGRKYRDVVAQVKTSLFKFFF